MRSREWIGVDFDGTLAQTVVWSGWADASVGAPIEPMVERVRRWLDEGKQVRIFTARVGPGADVEKQRAAVDAFCLEQFGRVLDVTCMKDFNMVELWDDKAVQVEVNVGEPTAYWQSRYE